MMTTRLEFQPRYLHDVVIGVWQSTPNFKQYMYIVSCMSEVF